MQKVSKLNKRTIVRIAVAAASAVAVLGSASAALSSTPPVSATPQKMPTFDGGVYASSYLGNTIYVGGSFTSATWSGKKSTRNGLAAFNAQTGALLPWDPAANGKVTSLATDPATQTVYVGGDFGTIDGTTRDALAALDATTGDLRTFKHTVAGSPRSLAVGHGLLYVGGHLTAVDGQARTNLAAFTLATGALSTAWAPTADDTVYTVVSDTNRIYIGGKFHKINGIAGTAKLAAVSVDAAVRDPAFRPSLLVLVRAAAIGPNGVFAAEGGQGGRVVAYSTTGAPQWTFTTDGDVQALAYLDGNVYAGGHFDNACKDDNTGVHGFCKDGATSRVKLAAVDGSTGLLSDWDPHANGVHGVFTMAANATLGTVAVGGEFTAVGGTSRGRFVQFR